MAISVTIADGQVFVCICIPMSVDVEELSGPFTEKDAALGHLGSMQAAPTSDCYAEADRLCELGVPFFIRTVCVGNDLSHGATHKLQRKVSRYVRLPATS